jgi:hypothetical protein
MANYLNLQQGESLTLISEYIAQYKPLGAHEVPPRLTLVQVVEILRRAEEAVIFFEIQLVELSQTTIEYLQRLAVGLEAERQVVRDNLDRLNNEERRDLAVADPFIVAEAESMDYESMGEAIRQIGGFNERTRLREEQRHALEVEFAGFTVGVQMQAEERLQQFAAQQVRLVELREISRRAVGAAQERIDDDIEWYRSQRARVLLLLRTALTLTL